MNHTNKHLKTLTLTACLALAAPNTFAQAFDAVRLMGAAPGKDGGTVGAAAISAYAYQGSDQDTTLLVPVLDYQWANGWFAGVTNGLGYNFSDRPQMQYGLRMTANMGRKESAASDLRGMGDVAAAAEGGAFFNYVWPQGVFLTSSVRYGAGANNNGVVVDLGTGYMTEMAPQWHLGLGAALTLANADYMQSFFGVSGAQSAASGHAMYTAGAGARDVRANVALTYSIDPRTAVTAALYATHLLADAKDSALTRKPTAVSGVVAISYGF
jgi:outer membrane scaffolding protein for murein synthesis (MipA/OmpV family)